MQRTTSNPAALSRRELLSIAAGALAAGALARPAQAAGGLSLEPLLAARTWLNGAPSSAVLRGKVVLVDVFTFDCINCKNITPNLRLLERTKRADGLAILGIHSPETPYEHEHDAVVVHLAELGVVWPVAIDNDFALWNAYRVQYWPTQLIFDRRGTLRKTVIGDSQDGAVDAAVDALLAERA